MSERTLRETANIPHSIPAHRIATLMTKQQIDPLQQYVTVEDCLTYGKRLLDAHTAAQPAPDAVAEASDLFAFVPHNAVCATDDCGKPASVNFERSGVGSFYCMDCFMRIAKEPRP